MLLHFFFVSDCAELLYLHLLADTEAVGPNYEEYSTAISAAVAAASNDATTAAEAVAQIEHGRRWCFFSTQAALDEALGLLSGTSWDAADKQALVTARAALSLLAGFQDVSTRLILSASSAGTGGGASTAPVDNISGGGGGSAAAVADELDSYEALVRDAGELRWDECITNEMRALNHNLNG